MKRLELTRFLSSINNVDLFTLCHDFGKLSLDDDFDSSNSNSGNKTGDAFQYIGESSSSQKNGQPSSYNSSISRYLRSWIHTPWNICLSEHLKAPFIEYPRSYMESLSFKACDLTMGLGFRFHPGQSSFLVKDLQLPECFDRLTFLKNSLDLMSTNVSPFNESMFTYSSIGSGLRSIVNETMSKTLVEAITYCDGSYGRFLVLVSMGLGCTVWYGFARGTMENPPFSNDVFTDIHTYEPFFNADYKSSFLKKLHFLEKNDISESISDSFGSELPFAEISIPASGYVLKSVSLGVMVSVFLSLGILPTSSNNEDEE